VRGSPCGKSRRSCVRASRRGVGRTAVPRWSDAPGGRCPDGRCPLGRRGNAITLKSSKIHGCSTNQFHNDFHLAGSTPAQLFLRPSGPSGPSGFAITLSLLICFIRFRFLKRPPSASSGTSRPKCHNSIISTFQKLNSPYQEKPYQKVEFFILIQNVYF